MAVVIWNGDEKSSKNQSLWRECSWWWYPVISNHRRAQYLSTYSKAAEPHQPGLKSSQSWELGRETNSVPSLAAGSSFSARNSEEKGDEGLQSSPSRFLKQYINTITDVVLILSPNKFVCFQHDNVAIKQGRPAIIMSWSFTSQSAELWFARNTFQKNA